MLDVKDGCWHSMLGVWGWERVVGGMQCGLHMLYAVARGDAQAA